MGSAVGIWSMIDQHKAAKSSDHSAKNAMFDSAVATGRAEAREEAERQSARNSQAKEAQNPDLEEMEKRKRRRGVQSTYTAQGDGSGGGMMKGTSLTPIGGGDTGAIAGT